MIRLCVTDSSRRETNVFMQIIALMHRCHIFGSNIWPVSHLASNLCGPIRKHGIYEPSNLLPLDGRLDFSCNRDVDRMKHLDVHLDIRNGCTSTDSYSFYVFSFVYGCQRYPLSLSAYSWRPSSIIGQCKILGWLLGQCTYYFTVYPVIMCQVIGWWQMTVTTQHRQHRH